MLHRAVVTELVGTYFLMLTIGMVALEPDGAGELAPVAVAMVLTALVYMGAHVSGAHYNPAVTLAMVLRGRTRGAEALAFVAVQLAGAALAAGTVAVLKPGLVRRAIDADPVGVPLAEFLFTLALVLVIFGAAVSRSMKGNPSYGIAIGAVVGGGAYAVGPVSSAAFNPAVTLGLALLGIIGFADSWAWVMPQLAAGVAGALLFALVEPVREREAE